MIYLDNNATTPMAPEVEAVYLRELRQFGNASSVHGLGQAARKTVNESREKIAALLGASESSIVFTSGGTEAINLAMLGTFFPAPAGKHLIISAVEHSAVLKTAEFLTHLGVEVTTLGVDAEGKVDLAELERAIRPQTALIAVMFVNNELGNVYPVKAIGEIAKAHKIPYLCDAVQAVGRLEINLGLLPLDLMCASAHKFHGPKGAGLLFLREGLRLTPMHHGGRQERGRRAGTENVPAIAAMATALELASQNLLATERRISRLRERLENGLRQRVEGFVVQGDPDHRLPGTLNFRISGIPAESLLMNLDMAGIAASSGAACDSGSIEPSHVLLAMGLSKQEAAGGLRFSLSRYNTEAEIDEVLRVLPKLVQRIRAARDT